MTNIYRTTGSLTGTIAAENVGLAAAYLNEYDMTQFVDERIDKGVVVRVQWVLNANGHDYYVEVITSRELTVEEMDTMSAWISGQNSDGLGEGFEQQSFAEETYEVEYEDDEDEYDTDGYRMISFDWETNNSVLRQIV